MTAPLHRHRGTARRRAPAVIALVIALLAASAAAAADAPPIPKEIVRLRVESADYAPSRDALSIVLRAEIAAGWHINAHVPSSEALVPTTLTVVPPAGFQVGEIEYPPPEKRKLRFAGGDALDVYGGRVRFRIPVSVETDFTNQGASFRAELHYQACDDTRCLRPAKADRTFVVRRPGAGSRASASSTNQVPVEDWLGRYGLATTLALVFAMGLGLNLTPCVYPLISVTIAYFGGQARARRSRLVLLSAVYALGIALTFSALGVSAALSGGLFGRALQSPLTLIGLASVMVLLALSNFGFYSLQPPAWLLQRAGASSGPGLAGALFMGLTMGIVAAPCVGPIVVGLLVAVGARGDPALGFLLFFTLALGLGAPYVALASAAGSIARLPRAGEWLIWIERLFGFVLLALALYFVSPLLEPQTLRWATAGLLASAGVALGFLDRNGGGFGHFVGFKRAFGFLAVVAALWIALPPAGARPEGISWTAFSTHALEQARSDRRPVVVDFRADWCMPCIEMERTTFVSPEVAAKSTGFVMLRADVTQMSSETEQLLTKFGVLGVPTTIFFAADGSEKSRRVGYVDAEEFARLLDDTRKG